MHKFKLIFSSLSLATISFPIALSCSGVGSIKTLSDDAWVPWPISVKPSKYDIVSKYVSSDKGVDYYSASSWADYSAVTPEPQWDLIVNPYNPKTNTYLTYTDGQHIQTDGTASRLDCLLGGASGKQVWSGWVGFPGDTTMNCSWNLTDVATNKQMLAGTDADYTMLVDCVSILPYESDDLAATDPTYAITAIKFKFNRYGITNKSALGYNKKGYWFDRQIKFNYHYDWSSQNEAVEALTKQEGGPRNYDMSYTFSFSQKNVTQDEILGKDGTTDISNWTINSSGVASYATSPQDPNTFDTDTKTLLIPTRIASFPDNFITGTDHLPTSVLPSFINFCEKERTDTTKYTIGKYAFANRPLQTVDIPSCSYIDSFAFSCALKQDSASLYNIQLRDLTQIGDNAFEYQNKLTTFNAPMLSTLGANVFLNCKNLTSVNLPKLTSFPTNGTIFSTCNVQQIRIGAPNNTPINYNDLLNGTPILTSNVGVSNFNILIPAANAETDSTKSGWATSYYNPTFGWKGTRTASGHDLSFFFIPYN